MRSYNSRGWLETERELFGNETIYHYDCMGRLIWKKKKDQVEIHYRYDALGRLKHLFASDVNYLLNYDLHDNITEVYDDHFKFTQYRSYDQRDNLIKEEIRPGLFLHYSYDNLNRVTEMTLPDGSRVTYTYDANHLRKVERNGVVIKCDYDLQENVIKIKNPSGIITNSYDLLGRNIKIEMADFESTLERFDPVGNLIFMKQKDRGGLQELDYSYDRFNHLNQRSKWIL